MSQLSRFWKSESAKSIDIDEDLDQKLDIDLDDDENSGVANL